MSSSRRRGWQAWRPELFADIFATLALGPAFTSTLIDFLPSEPELVAYEYQSDPVWCRHPTSTLRVLLSTATLGRMGSFDTDAAELRELWTTAYPSHSMQDFVADVDTVVDAILTGPYETLGGKALNTLIDFGAHANERAHRDADRVLKETDPTSSDARELIAAARFAFEANPTDYRNKRVSDRILKRIRKEQTVGVRASPATPVPRADRSARAAERGRWLADHLAQAHAKRPSDRSG